MKKFIVLAIIVAIALGEEIAVSTKMIREINKKQTTWKAGHNPITRMPKSQARSLLGVDMEAVRASFDASKVKEFTDKQLRDVPETFDSRTQWPNCPTIQDIRNQKQCGSCWAFGAVESMSDRQCIHKNEVVRLSSEDMLSCGKGLLAKCGNCEKGGQPECAWYSYVHHGVVSEDCYPYTAGNTSSSPTPECTKKCTGNTQLDYDQDKRKGSTHYIMDGEKKMKAELSENGPFEVVMMVYSDFFSYESGVYQHVSGGYEGGHAIKLVGYGEEDGVPYWTCANSWDVTWGEKGFFRIRRGNNECDIEVVSYAGLPK